MAVNTNESTKPNEITSIFSSSYENFLRRLDIHPHKWDFPDRPRVQMVRRVASYLTVYIRHSEHLPTIHEIPEGSDRKYLPKQLSNDSQSSARPPRQLTRWPTYDSLASMEEFFV